jgi:hypothetical protein
MQNVVKSGPHEVNFLMEILALDSRDKKLHVLGITKTGRHSGLT